MESRLGAAVSRYVSGCLKDELVGLEEMGDDCWRVHFGPVLIGVLDANKTRALNDQRQIPSSGFGEQRVDAVGALALAKLDDPEVSQAA
jgi:hypothetical protein